MLRYCVGQSRGRQSLVGVLALILTIGGGAVANAQLDSGLISQAEAQSIGLVRSWFARAQVNPARSRAVHWVLSGEQLFVVTNAGTFHALDAGTGQTLWITHVGNPDYPSFGPGTNDQLVALVNGSTLYLLDRGNGHLVSQRPVGGAPGAGPSLSQEYVFVPLVTGRIEGYPLDDESNRRAWFYQSYGRALVRPLATPQNVAWVTDAGYMYVASANNPRIRYRLETVSEFAASPAYHAPLIYAVSLAGELFAVDEQTGRQRWRYLTGFPTARAPAVVGDRLYVTSDEPMLHAIDANTGAGQWEAPGIVQFAATTKQHVYGIDNFGTLHVLDRTTGRRRHRISTGGAIHAMVNDQTDRLFLISETGLVQCLHEIGAEQPTYYIQPPSAAEGEAAEPPLEGYRGEGEPPTEPRPAAARPSDAEGPFAPLPEVDAENPFGPPAGGEADESDEPADESPFGVEDENPFG